MRKVPSFLSFNPETPKNAPFEGMVNRSGKNPDPQCQPGPQFEKLMEQIGKNKSTDGATFRKDGVPADMPAPPPNEGPNTPPPPEYM